MTQDEVDEVKSGMECGLKVDDNDLKFESGDEIICYTTRMDREELYSKDLTCIFLTNLV